MTDTATSVTARNRWRCEEYRGDVHFINPGDTYARLVAFPGDVNSGTQPWVMRICADHYAQHGRTMPPKSRRRARANPTTSPTDA